MIKLYLPVSDPTVVNSSTAAAVGDIAGDCSWYKHATYGWWVVRFVQFLNAVTYAAGQVVSFCDAARTTVTNDIAGGATATTTNNQPQGSNNTEPAPTTAGG